MTKEQRIAIGRIISDMIKADNIIEETEIRDMKRLMSDYSLSHQDMIDARNIKFSDAVPILRELSLRERKDLVAKIYSIAQSDNVCVPREALLLIALKYCLLYDERNVADRLSHRVCCQFHILIGQVDQNSLLLSSSQVVGKLIHLGDEGTSTG